MMVVVLVQVDVEVEWVCMVVVVLVLVAGGGLGVVMVGGMMWMLGGDQPEMEEVVLREEVVVEAV